jgi:hypothetical protein
MRIERVETFQADAGSHMFSFLKVTTADVDDRARGGCLA